LLKSSDGPLPATATMVLTPAVSADQKVLTCSMLTNLSRRLVRQAVLAVL